MEAVTTQTNSQVAKFKPSEKIGNAVTAGKLLERYKKDFEQIVVKHIPLDLILKAGMHCVREVPALANCTNASFVAALMVFCETGLIPGKAYQEGYILPFRDKKRNTIEATVVFDYRGLIKLARQSGEVATVEARVVYEGDEFEYEYGLNSKLVHRHCPQEQRGKLTHAYAIGRFKDQSVPPVFEVMTWAEIDKIRQNSPGANSDAWVNHFDEQARKTAVKRVCKYLPREYRLIRALQVDDAADTGEAPDVQVEELIPEMEIPPQSKTDALADQIAGKQGKEKAEPKAKVKQKTTKKEELKVEPVNLDGLVERIAANKDKLPEEWVAKYPIEVLGEYTDDGLRLVDEEIDSFLEAKDDGRTEQQPELDLEQKAADESTPGAKAESNSPAA